MSIHRQNGGVHPDGIYPIRTHLSIARRMSRTLFLWQMTPEDALWRLSRFHAQFANGDVTVGVEEVPVDFNA